MVLEYSGFRRVLVLAALGVGGALIGGAAGLPLAAPIAAAADVVPQFVTGAVPIGDEEYDGLPKQGTFRAWLPKQIDLTGQFPKPGYQGQQPSCVAWATTYAARSFLYGQQLGRQPTDPTEEVSPAYVYNRLRPAGSACDRPIRIVDALNLLKNEGSVTFADFPDDVSKCAIPASAEMRAKAAALRLGSWRAIKREDGGGLRSPVVLDDIKGALARGEPVVFAMPVMPDWYALKDGSIYTHAVRENTNYHAMTLIGYDEERQAFRAINSWGEGWGDRGYGWIAYDTFRLLVTEAYVVEAPRAPAPTVPGEAEITPRQAFDILLAKLPCGAASATMDRGRLRVTGFGGGKEELDALRSAAEAVDPKVDWAVAHHPWPQCEGELTLAKPLGVGDVTLALVSETGHPLRGEPVTMRAGDKFGFNAVASADRPYVTVVYLQADGSAVNLYDGVLQPDRTGRRSITKGISGPQEDRYQVGPPYGNEMLIAIASATPFWGDRLPQYGTERQFLTALRARLASMPAGSVSAAVLRMQTKG